MSDSTRYTLYGVVDQCPVCNQRAVTAAVVDDGERAWFTCDCGAKWAGDLTP